MTAWMNKQKGWMRMKKNEWAKKNELTNANEWEWMRLAETEWERMRINETEKEWMKRNEEEWEWMRMNEKE